MAEEIPTPAAAVAIATGIVEPPKRCTRVSSCP